MWHYHLDHPKFIYLKMLFTSLFINKDAKLFKCEICQLAKHNRIIYSPQPYKQTILFSLFHGDILELQTYQVQDDFSY